MTKKEPPVSIIMITAKIDKAEPSLRSLLKQDYRNKEIIVVNGNPKSRIPDSTLELIKLHKIRVINNFENSGMAEAINVGIKASKTNAVLLSNDDYFYPEKDIIKHLMGKLYSDEKIIAAGFLIVWPIKDWHNYGFTTKLFTFNKILNYKREFADSFKKELFKKVGLFDSKNFKCGGEDGDMRAKIIKAGYKIGHIQDEVIHAHYDKKGNLLKILKKEYMYGKGHGARKRKDGILPRIGLFDFEIRILFIIGFIIGLFTNPLISLFCFLPFFFAALIKCIKAYPKTKWIPGLIFSPFAIILVFLIQTAGAIKQYVLVKPDKKMMDIEYLKE